MSDLQSTLAAGGAAELDEDTIVVKQKGNAGQHEEFMAHGITPSRVPASSAPDTHLPRPPNPPYRGQSAKPHTQISNHENPFYYSSLSPATVVEPSSQLRNRQQTTRLSTSTPQAALGSTSRSRNRRDIYSTPLSPQATISGVIRFQTNPKTAALTSREQSIKKPSQQILEGASADLQIFSTPQQLLEDPRIEEGGSGPSPKVHKLPITSKLRILNHMKTIKFLDGHASLNNVPENITHQILKWCREANSSHLPCARPFLSDSLPVSRFNSGAPARFEDMKTGSTLMAARYQYGSNEQIIVVHGPDVPGFGEPAIVNYESQSSQLPNAYVWSCWVGNRRERKPSLLRVLDAPKADRKDIKEVGKRPRGNGSANLQNEGRGEDVSNDGTPSEAKADEERNARRSSLTVKRNVLALQSSAGSRDGDCDLNFGKGDGCPPTSAKKRLHIEIQSEDWSDEEPIMNKLKRHLPSSTASLVMPTALTRPNTLPFTPSLSTDPPMTKQTSLSAAPGMMPTALSRPKFNFCAPGQLTGRIRPLEMCKTVQKLFAHARVAGIASKDTELLSLNMIGMNEKLIMKDDEEDFNAIIGRLEGRERVYSIMVQNAD